MTKDELIKLGYGKDAAIKIIRTAKRNLVQEGLEYYSNSRLGRVPVQAVEAILGITLSVEVN